TNTDSDNGQPPEVSRDPLENALPEDRARRDLFNARGALAERDLDQADRELKSAEQSPAADVFREEIDHLRKLYGYHVKFWDGVRAGIKRLQSDKPEDAL